ncbi:MAG: hypothetical protein ABWK00_03430 [Desulfurococcaceae archaeon]
MGGIQLKPIAFKCSNNGGRTAVVVPVTISIKEEEDYTKVITVSWRCNLAEKCNFEGCHYRRLAKGEK